MQSSVKIGLIGGSGLGAAIASSGGTPHYLNTPFGPPSDAIYEADWSGVPVFALARHGVGHRLSPTEVPYRANLFAMKMLGVTHVLASGAVGSLREEYKPRDLVVIDQAIDKTVGRAATFFEKSAVHVEMAEPFCLVLRQILKEAADDLARKRGEANAVKVHHGGCYVAMEGPAFSTRAESLMHRLWGGGVVGMTLMPEAKLAREAELPYAMVSLVTDYDSWRPTQTSPLKPAANAEPTPPKAKHELLAEIIGNLKAASDNAMELLRAAVERIAADPSKLDACPARDALELAIWSEKSAIEGQEIERLRPLWGRYFPGR